MPSSRKNVSLVVGVCVLVILGAVFTATFAIKRTLHSLFSYPVVIAGDVMIERSGGVEKLRQEARQMFARFNTEQHILTVTELDRFPVFSALSTQYVTVDVTVTPHTNQTDGVIEVNYGTHIEREYIYVFQSESRKAAASPFNATPIHPQIYVSKKER